MQKVLVTGAGGMLGSAIAKYLNKDQNFKVYGTGRTSIQQSYAYIKTDLLNYDEVEQLLIFTNPDIIIHCAAIVNLNECELNKTEAYKLHVEATQKLASYKPGKCRFIYISTDSIFDGEKGNYSEMDTPAPLNYYALSKLEGEKAATEANPLSLIIRTNIYGFNPDKNSSSLFEWIYKNLSNQISITGFTDVFFNPLYIQQLAELISTLIDKKLTGIINSGCSQQISKYQFALLIADVFGFNKSLVKEGLSDDMSSIVKRPKNTTLSIDKLNKSVKRTFSIADGINQLKTDLIQRKKSS